MILLCAFWLNAVFQELAGRGRWDHWAVWGALALLWGLGKGKRREELRLKLEPFAWTALLYDSQHFYADQIRGRIRVYEPYWIEKHFFSIRTEKSGLLTLNEWFRLHPHPALDLVCGLLYLGFVGIFIGFVLLLSLRRWATQVGEGFRALSLRVSWAFFVLNALGYATYYFWPAAPPWYVAERGFQNADLAVRATGAGALRLDALLGVPLIRGMYARSADVFGAVPSLHVAYPWLLVWMLGRARMKGAPMPLGTEGAAWLYFLGMFFSAVYLDHHYVFDGVMGMAYATVVGEGFSLGAPSLWLSTRRSAGREKIAASRQVTSPMTAIKPKLTKAWFSASKSEP